VRQAVLLVRELHAEQRQRDPGHEDRHRGAEDHARVPALAEVHPADPPPEDDEARRGSHADDEHGRQQRRPLEREVGEPDDEQHQASDGERSGGDAYAHGATLVKSIPLPIETERLLLRAFTTADVPSMLGIYGDPDVMRHVRGVGVLDRRGTEALLEQYEQAQRERGFSTWAVVEKASGRTVGDAGFEVYRSTGEPELGYTLAADAWGRGFGSEAARACVDAAFAHLAVGRIVAKVEVDNERSLRLARRLGMTPIERIEVEGRPHVLLALERRRG
jgi:[ribosomal protein S5]-alanine N-acetyltransferase